jgi:undecaprenyldiphospho-muramoylpentapeptide beta-N-acetylglucosaminyltransferase
VYPALAVIDELGEKAEILWVGSVGGMEASLVSRAGIAFEAVPASGLHGVSLRSLPGNLWQLMRGYFSAQKILKRYRPDVLFFTGGFVGVPVGLAGWRLPKVVCVPDIEPALALKVLSRIAQLITVPAEASRKFFSSKSKILVSGYPFRTALKDIDREQARASLGLTSELPVVLVFGGSKGAHSINSALWNNLEALLEEAEIIHITGERDRAEGLRAAEALPVNIAARYRVFEYLHEGMAAALAAADLVLSRAGASTLGEYPAFGLPSILVPYPYAWRYQKVNAGYLVDQGAARLLEDHALDQSITTTILELLGNREELNRMGAAARALARPDAAHTIAIELERLALGKGRGDG